MGPMAMRPRHWGARTIVDRWRGYNAYHLEAGGRSVLFAGDSAETAAFEAVREPTLSVFGIGAYDPWITSHASPEQVWRMFRSTGGAYLLPMHHSTFTLSREPVGEPLERLRSAAGQEAWRLVATGMGEVWAGPSVGG